ncbi:MAG: branched-chain amino acid ABC transporter permease [Alphaproteobacteria bacterium]
MDLLNFLGIQLINALWLSALLFMLGVGLSVVFGLLDVLNLAHCTLYMFGAYIGLSIVNVVGSYWIALLLAPILVTVVGAVLYELLLKRLRGNHLIQALVTFGLLFVGYDVARMVWGVDQFKFPEPELLSGTIPIFDQTYPVYRLGVILVGLVTIIGLYLGLVRTRLGAIVRAGVDDRETAAMLGINIDRAFFIVFCIGTGLAGLAGVLAAPIRTVEPGMDIEILIPALVVVVIGGPGSLKGAVLGAFLIGLAETFGPVLLPEFASFIMYAVMAAILLWRPRGLLPVKPAH